MELTERVAVVHGGGGAVGGAVARALAREGARVYLTGRSLAAAQAVADEIVASGGRASAAAVDLTDWAAVDAFLHGVVDEAGDFHIVVDATGEDHVQGVPLREIGLSDYLAPVSAIVTRAYVAGATAAIHMTAVGDGVIVLLSTTAARVALPSDGFGPACAAVEAFARQLAGEVGPHGVRVVCIRADAVPGSVAAGSYAGAMWSRAADVHGSTLDDVMAAGGPGVPGALLRSELTLDALGDAVAFLASARASAMTATVTNLSRGALPDL
jgi:NAD(P)-dependent dehydrogenase (short-subunit alcohol dehydrogenase family)